ncbi:twin-arginine translocase subunit TatC [Sporosarcina sp. Marseille-Q4063]|uniref:twin-arginine translocase subunit TatC n=1 Tax=Sporosarcina sp. Marseille-Q4063 TaxID=2810514 RepID=UPI001BAFEA8F|nr:twin-arginine translocase subunit TatC [Sporosarcina sp. Marseille-Q4063]QUW20831.1 twin-arginine translocase subunit TatC [Sporosarcina sp. Marseille-Q4063]
MDPYGDHNREIMSPLDKPTIENQEVSEKTPEKKLQAVENTENNNAEANDKGSPESNSSLVDHLSDLRKQLIKSILTFLLFFIVVFVTINLWFPYVTRGHELIVLGPLEVVKFYMSISTALAVGLALPFLCHFLWQFVKPGLNERESQFLSLYSPIMFLLFLSGIAFGYFIVNPLSYNFLVSLGAMNFNVMVSAQEYASFLLMTTVPLGLLFELPIVAMFLATIGLLTAESMKKVRKWSYLSLAIISALITPPDFISQLIVLIPMALLYEISIYIVSRSEQRTTTPVEN